MKKIIGMLSLVAIMVAFTSQATAKERPPDFETVCDTTYQTVDAITLTKIEPMVIMNVTVEPVSYSGAEGFTSNNIVGVVLFNINVNSNLIIYKDLPIEVGWC